MPSFCLASRRSWRGRRHRAGLFPPRRTDPCRGEPQGPRLSVTEADLRIGHSCATAGGCPPDLAGSPRKPWIRPSASAARPFLWSIPSTERAASPQAIPALDLRRAGRRRAAVFEIVLAPALDEMFVATTGGGARCNGAPIAVSDRSELAGARLSAPEPMASDLRRSGLSFR